MTDLTAEPDPIGCRSIDDVVAYLSGLKAWARDMSFREITKRINEYRKKARIPEPAKLATVNDCFRTGRRRLNWDLVIDIGRALGLSQAGVTRLEQVCRLVTARIEQSDVADVRDSIPTGRPEFTGRKTEGQFILDGLQAAVRTRSPGVAVIHGPAGVGKTELSLQLAHHIVKEGYCADVQLFADLHGFDAQRPACTPEAVLSGLLRLLGCGAAEIAATAGAAGKAARFRQLLAGKATLLILDNVPGAEFLAPLLPGLPSTLVLVTSRNRDGWQEGAVQLPLRPLSVGEGKELLQRFDIAGRVDAEPEVAGWLVDRLCSGLPLDLVALGGQLADPAESAWTLSDHADRLHRFPRDQVQRPALAGSCQGLSPGARRAFRLLALLPRDDFTVHETAILSEVDQEEAEQALAELFNRHLLLRRHAGRYRFHDAVAEFARHLLYQEEPASAQHAALARLRNATTKVVTMRRAAVPPP